MIKAFTKTTNGSHIILGLSEDNIVKLKENFPIFIEGPHIDSSLGNITISIIYGKTEDEMVNMFTKKGIKIQHFRDERNKNEI